MADKKPKVKTNPEISQDPVAQEEEKNVDISTKKQKDFVAYIEKNTNTDITATENQRNKLAHWYNRRYGTLNREPQYPWVGSSNINMPLIDTEITKGKAPLMQVFDVNPVVSFTAVSAASFDKTDAAENTMQHLLTTRMRDFRKNMEIGADNMLQNGYSWVKINYEFQTQIVTEKIRKEEISQQELTEIAVMIAAIQQQQPIGKDQNGEPLIPTQEDLERFVTQFVVSKFKLNPQDKIDQDAVTDIMNFILNGDDSVSIKRNFISRHAPHVSIVDPSRLFPEEGVMDIQDTERITELFDDTSNDMRQKARTGWYDADAVDELLKKKEAMEVLPSKEETRNKSETHSKLDNDKRNREGLSATNRKGVIENKEVYCMYDIDNDGVDEKCLLIYNPETEIVLRFMEFPYEHGEWPYVQLRNEETDGRLYSPRGIPEIIDDLDDMTTQNHRNKLNAMTIGNAPTFKVRLGSNINPNNINWSPGSFINVMGMNDIEQINVNVKDFSFDNEEVNLKHWIESLVGSFDSSFREQKSESRTAAGTNAIVGLQQSSQSLKISRFQNQMKKVYHQVWALWMQYGPSDFDFVTGNGELTKLSKNDIVGQFDLVPSGTTANTNPQLEAAKANQRFQTIMLLLQNFGGPEQVQQVLGVEYELDIATALKDMFNKDDFVASNRILRRRSDDEIKQIQEQQAQAQAQAQQQQQEQQALDQNQPQSIGTIQNTLKGIERDSPNGGNQRIAL